MTGSRRGSRGLALQGLYQWLVNASDADDILAQIRDMDGYAKADQAYLKLLVRGVVFNADALRERIRPYLDRPTKSLSPIEHALLLMAACELATQPGTPYRVVINEAVELAKSYGGARTGTSMSMGCWTNLPRNIASAFTRSVIKPSRV